jgi:hypothetical protein
MDELPLVSWAYWIMLRSSTSETPFLLAYGAKALNSLEVGIPTIWIESLSRDNDDNDEAFSIELDLVEDKRQKAFIKLVSY